ncbi:MAG: ABC transporter substrate-binding protein [Thermoleophilia bacterium]|nr:ABC transporter substrate-binding protein [Thermoleophilia bacterium]
MNAPTIGRLRRFATPIAAVALVATALGLAGCGSDDDEPAAAATTAAAEGPSVVASTGWVAAIATLAGAGEVSIIAPSSTQHPPDYEPKPSDLAAVAGADYVLLAGFEGFAKQLTEAAGGDAKVITVATTYDPAKLEAEIVKLGTALGTADAAATGGAAIRGELEEICADLKTKVAGTPPVTVAHLFVTDWAACAGLTPAGTYGPAPITPGEVKKLSALDPALVLENLHMAGSGEAVAGSTDATMVELINFPDDADLDLAAVARTDADLIAGALAP